MTTRGQTLMPSGLMGYLSFLLELIETRDWVSFKQTALPDSRTFRIASESVSQCEKFDGITLLHACARYDPPVDLVDRMIQLHPQALRTKDHLGRLPLHVAAGCGASPLVMKVLTSRFPQACSIQDEDGMTPLHYACDVGCVLFEGDECRPRGPPHLKTIGFLLEGSRDAATLEDVDGVSAVGYAIMSNASLEVVKLLQRTMQDLRKKQKVIDGPRSRACPMGAVRA